MPAPKTSKIPKKRPFKTNSDVEADDQIHVKKKKSTVKKAGGGIMRGAGAATKGTRFTRSC